MQVEINNEDTILLPLLGHVIIGTDESCDIVLEGSSDEPKKLCSIIYDKSACILEVFNNEEVLVNLVPVQEMIILHPGDRIQLAHNLLKIIDENKLPKASTIPFKLNPQKDTREQLITSVSGLRSFNEKSYGSLFLVGDKNSYTHKPVHDDDIPFSVSYIENYLTLLCQKDKSIDINGNKANYVILRNGDYINTGHAKYSVESPGTSAFSKYSPSHPRNIQLSEEYLEENDTKKETNNSFFKKNLWWITLLIGLVVIALILSVLKK